MSYTKKSQSKTTTHKILDSAGIYKKDTVKAVKQFQKAKGLKVTRKVNQRTAKKLKII